MWDWIVSVFVAITMFFSGGAEETPKEAAKEKSSPPTVTAQPVEAPIEEQKEVKEQSVEAVEQEAAPEVQEEPIEESVLEGESFSPIEGHETVSESVQEGVEGQVSTVWGNGSKGQAELSMDNPRDIQLDSKGHIYFVDGSQKTAKLRMFDGKQNQTVVDLAGSKIARRDGFFASAGLAIIHDNAYISSTEDAYRVVNGRITQLTPKIKKYMEAKRLSYLYRMEPHGEYLYFLFMNKSKQYNLARYNVAGGGVEEIIPTKPMPSPYNFYVHGDNEVFFACETGFIMWEKLFPRETIEAWKTADPKTEVVDVWIGSNDSMYYVQWEDQVRAAIYENPVGENAEEILPVAGGVRGFTDGIQDEVEMDHPIDFIWDGSGYLFADMGNHSIRKLWTKVGPMNH